MKTRNVQDTAWITVAALYFAGVGAALQFAKFAVPFDSLGAAYPDAGVALGFAVSLISVLGVLCGFAAGLAVAVVGFRWMLLLAMLLGAILSAFQALMVPLWGLFALRIIEGLSHLVIVVAAPTLMVQITAPRHRAVVMTVWSTFFGGAFVLVSWVGVPFVAAYGLPRLLAAHAVWMVAVAGGLAFVLPAIAPDRHQPEWPSMAQIWRDHLQAYASPSQAAPALGWIAYAATYVATLTVVPGQLAPADRIWAVPLMPLAGLVVSLTLGVVLTRFMSAIGIVLTGFSLAALVTLALSVYPHSAGLAIALLAVLGLVQSGSFAAIPELNKTPQDQALANGALAQGGNLGNLLGTPALLTLLALGGATALYIGLLVLCLAGFAQHLWQRTRRRRA